MSDWFRMPTPNARGEYATEAEAAQVRARQRRAAKIFSEGGDPFADEEPAPPSPSGGE